MSIPRIVSPNQRQAARDDLLVKETNATRAPHALAAERRRLPMVPVEQGYAFEGPNGEESLLALDVLTLCGTEIAAVVAFRTPEVFPNFDLPPEVRP